MNIGKAIKLCRSQKGLTQKAVAEKAEISIAFLSMIEKGKRDLNFQTLETLAKGLEVPLNILIFMGMDNKEAECMPANLRNQLSKLVMEILADENK